MIIVLRSISNLSLVILLFGTFFNATESRAAINTSDVKSAATAGRYVVNLRVGIRGQTPISVSAVTKAGKRTTISEISADGQKETFIELYALKTELNSKPGLWMDVRVSQKNKGKVQSSDKLQLVALENQEAEINLGQPKGKRASSNEALSLSVLAHRL